MWKGMVIYVLCGNGEEREKKKSPFDAIIEDYHLETVVRKLKKVHVYREKEQEYLRALQEFYDECPEDNEVLILEENVNFHQQAKWPFSTFREFLSLLPPDYCSCRLSFTPHGSLEDNQFLRILPDTLKAEEEERISLFSASVVSRKGIRQMMRSYHQKVHDKNMEHWLEKEEKDKVENVENVNNVNNVENVENVENVGRYRTNIAFFG